MGELIQLRNSWIKESEFIVTGVFKDVPSNSHIKFDILFSYPTLKGATEIDHENSWTWRDFNTYIQIKPEANPRELESRINTHVADLRREVLSKYNYRQEFLLQPLSSIHLNSNLLQESEPEENGDSETVYFLGLIALLILIIAWVNYINLATAKSLERSKEVGVRKVMGAFKSTIATQFLIESLLINLLALVLSILIVVIILPYFAQFTQSTLSLSQIFRNDIWLLVLGVFFTGSIFSSLYPAIVLSSFQPIYTLKRKNRFCQ